MKSAITLSGKPIKNLTEYLCTGVSESMFIEIPEYAKRNLKITDFEKARRIFNTPMATD